MMPDSYIRDQLEKYGNAVSLTEGVSMRPFLKSRRDSVVLTPPKDNLKRLDVVLYLRRDKLIMHRVIRVKKDGVLIIRGDNTFKNEYVKRDDVIAVMTSFTRKGKAGTVNDLGYRFYSAIWTLIYPIRYPIAAIYRFFTRGFRYIGRKLKRKK